MEKTILMFSYATVYTYPSELDTSGSTIIQPDNLIVIEQLLGYPIRSTSSAGCEYSS